MGLLFFVMGVKKVNDKLEFLFGFGGKLWVDSCGLDWIADGDSRDYDSKVKKMKLIGDFGLALRRRGNFLTTCGVRGEILHSRDHYRKYKRGVIRALAARESVYVSEDNVHIPATRERMDTYSGWVKTYNNILTVLEEGVILYFPERFRVDVRDVRDYVDKMSEERGISLSDVDKGIVIDAVSVGGDSGVLSADCDLIDVFEKSVRKFELSGCFICDSLKRRSYPVLFGGRALSEFG